MINEFKEKFSQLLLHYSTLDATIKDPGMHPPLTNQQIFDAVEEILRDKLNVTLNNFNSSSLKTPTNEIVVGTPNAPDVLRMDYNHNALYQKRMTSFNSMTPSEEDDKSQSSTNLSSHSEEKMEVSDTDKSSVSSHKDNENGNITTEKFTNGYDILSKDHDFKKELQKLECSANGTVYTMVDDAHKNAMKVISKLEELRAILVQPETRPNRRLSTMMTLPPLNKSHNHQPHQNHHQPPGSTNPRTIARAKALRRSIHQLNDDVPVTPTSSRPSLIAPPSHVSQHAPASGKKPSGIVKPASKLPSALGQHNRSNSTLALAEANKSAAATTATSKSPSRSLPMRSAKYAHVTSTIPKPLGCSAAKRKAL